jgi:hypothetical protein
MSLALIGHVGRAVAQGVGAPAPITVIGGSHLLGGGFLSLLDYSFYICGPFLSM